jgi:hypothetical protein
MASSSRSTWPTSRNARKACASPSGAPRPTGGPWRRRRGLPRRDRLSGHGGERLARRCRQHRGPVVPAGGQRGKGGPRSAESAERCLHREGNAARLGLDADAFSGHNLRSGFLTSAAARGASLFKMMDVSRHRSVDTLRGYVRDADAAVTTPGRDCSNRVNVRSWSRTGRDWNEGGSPSLTRSGHCPPMDRCASRR